MLSNSLKRINRTNRLITVDDISDSLLSGRSPAFISFWKDLQIGSYDSALSNANQICKREPNVPDGYVLKARALFQLKRYVEAEAELLHVMKMANDNNLIRNDVEGMVKLKDELANSRVEILRENNFRDPIDIAEMHWNECRQSILDLIGFRSNQRRRADGGRDAVTVRSQPMEVDIEIIDIIGPEKAKQLYPDLMFDSPKHKSTPNANNYSSYGKRVDTNRSNLELSGEFPVRDKTKKSVSIRDDIEESNKDKQLKTCQQKILELEAELRKVYKSMITLTDEKKSLKKKCETMEQQLDKVFDKELRPEQREPQISYEQRTPKQRSLVFTNSNRSGERFKESRPYERGDVSARLGTSILPDPQTGRYPPGILPLRNIRGDMTRGVSFMFGQNLRTVDDY